MTKVTQLSLDDEGGLGRRRIHLREISGDSEAPLETVGQDLRAARLRRGDDLATVSKVLKIRKDHLEAVEEDDIESLPGKTYAIGFVRSYATYLGLDTTATVERFKQEITGRHDEHVPSAPVMHDDDQRRLPYGWRIVAGVVCVALIYGAWHLLSAGPAPQPVPPAPELATSKPAPAEAPSQDSAPAPDNSQTANVPPPAAQAPATKPDASKPDNSQAAQQKLANAATSGQAAATPSAAAGSQAAAPVAGSGHVFGEQNKNARVVLHARGDVRVTVRDQSGKIFLNQDLKAGDTYQVPDVVGLSMATNDAGAVEVDLDGIALGRPGKQQEILGKVSLDPQSLVDRFDH